MSLSQVKHSEITLNTSSQYLLNYLLGTSLFYCGNNGIRGSNEMQVRENLALFVTLIRIARDDEPLAFGGLV